MSRLLPNQSSSQPQQAVNINRAHPLAKDLVFAHTPLHRTVDAVNTTIKYTYDQSAGDGYNFISLRGGIAYAPRNYVAVISSRSAPVTSSHSAFLVCSVEADAFPLNYSGYQLMAWGDNSSPQFGLDSSGFVYASYPQNSVSTTTTTAITLRKVITIGYVINSAGTTLYVDGKTVGSSATTYGIDINNYPRPYGYDGDGPFTTRQIFRYLSMGWQRALNPAEVYQLSKNPWQLFQSQHRKLTNVYAQVVLDNSRKFLLFFG